MDSEFFRGMVQAEVQNLKDAILEMKEENARRFDGLEKKVDGLRLWRAHVIGVSVAVSTVLSLALTAIIKAWAK